MTDQARIRTHTLSTFNESNKNYFFFFQELEQEAPQSIKKTKPAQIWPTEGRIVVRNLKMRYRKHLPMVLRGINFDIHPNEKVGIVGRTGSGKPSHQPILTSV